MATVAEGFPGRPWVGIGVAYDGLSTIKPATTVGHRFLIGKFRVGFVIMKKLNRIALYFATYSSNQLNSFAMLALACLKNNVLFPDLPVSIADLTALLAAYQTALTNAAQGGVVNTAIKNEAAAALIVAEVERQMRPDGQ